MSNEARREDIYHPFDPGPIVRMAERAGFSWAELERRAGWKRNLFSKWVGAGRIPGPFRADEAATAVRAHASTVWPEWAEVIDRVAEAREPGPVKKPARKRRVAA